MAAPKDKKSASEYPEPLADIAKLPGDDREAADTVCRDLVAGGSERVTQLVGIIGEFGTDEGVKPRYALHALALYCCRKGADTERALFAKTLAGQLQEEHSPSVKAFLVRQLQFAGTPTEVPALAKLIPDARLGLPAVAALVSIGDETAATALDMALSRAEGRTRIGVIQGLGQLRDTKAASHLAILAKETDGATRLAAVHALGRIGTTAAVDAVKKAATAESGYERTQGQAACLTLAERLREQGEGKASADVYQHLLDTSKEKHIRHAATQGLNAKKGASK